MKAWTRLRICVLILPFAVSGSNGRAQEATPGTKVADGSEEVFVVEDLSTVYTFEENGSGSRESVSRIRIQSEAGVQRFGVLTFPYQGSAEELSIHFVRVVKPDGTSVSTPDDSTQDMPAEITREAPFYSDLREKHVSVRGLGVGDMLEFHVAWRIAKPLVPGQFWAAFDVSTEAMVRKGRLLVRVPRSRAVRWKSSVAPPQVVDEGSRRIYTWTSSGAARTPEDERASQEALTGYQTVRGRLPALQVQVSSFPTWEAVGSWYTSLIRDRIQPSAAIRAKAAELTRNLTDEDAKIRAIYGYVSTQIRYIGVAFGIGRYQPHMADEVLENGYGDCKDQHALLASLLASAGIRSYPALIGSSRVIVDDVPSPGQFDHLITAVPRGEGFLWLDTTPQVAPAGYLIDRLRGKRALVIPPDAPARLVETPSNPPAPHRRSFGMVASLGDDGTLQGDAKVSFFGDDAALLIRSGFRQASMAQWKDVAQYISSASGFGGDVSDVIVSSITNPEEPIHWTYKYARRDYSNWENRRISAPVLWIVMPQGDEASKTPIWLGTPGETQFEASVTVPGTASPRLPRSREIRERFAEYTARYTMEGRVWKTERRLRIISNEISPGESDAYRKFVKEVHDDQASFLDLDGAPRATPASYQEAIWELPMSEKAGANEAYEKAQGAVQRGSLPDATKSLRRSVEVDPGFTRAWLWLGELYRAQRNAPQAIGAYRAAVKASPQEPLGYKVLAFQLMNLGRTDEGIATLRLLTEVAPHEADGFFFLGVALSDQGRERDAVAALEAANRLEPDRADVSVALGAAYATVGESTKALERFDRAFAKDSSSLWLNAGAYALAKANAHLERAREWSQRALDLEAKASREVSLGNLKEEDLRRTALVASTWHTLGWVAARQGRLPQAEEYLQASWALSQEPPVGDHLAQLYERSGKLVEAMRVYELALASGPIASKDRKPMEARLTALRAKGLPARTGVSADEELTRLRTVKLSPITTKAVSAEYDLLVSPGPKVEEVRFVSGAKELKSAGEAIRSARLSMSFPGTGQPRLVRRGVLSCAPTSGCSLVLYPPALVRSLE